MEIFPREDLLKTIDNSVPSKKYLHLIADLNRRQDSILFQLCSGYIGLNQYLFYIHKSDTLVCPNCQSIMVETVKHFLLDCPYYQHKWQWQIWWWIRCQRTMRIDIEHGRTHCCNYLRDCTCWELCKFLKRTGRAGNTLPQNYSQV